MEDGGPEVKVYGSWSDVPTMMQNSFDEPLPLLYGNVFGTRVTLMDVRVTHSTTNMSPLQDTTMHARYSLEGLWLDADEVNFTDVRFQLFNHDEWTGWDAYPNNTDFMLGEDGATLTYRAPDDLSARLLGANLRLVDESTNARTSQPSGWLLKSASTFVLRLDKPTPLDEVFDRWISPMEFLLMTATRQEPGVSRLSATNREWVFDNERHKGQRWVDIRHWQPARPEKDRRYHELLHRLSDFDFNRQMPLVYKATEQHRYSIEHFAALRGSNFGGHLARFVAAAQLVESFHRTLHPRETGRDLDVRLNGLDGDVGRMIKAIIGNGVWAREVRDLRDIVVHGLRASEELTQDVRSLQVATTVLLMIFEARMLVEFGFTAEQARKLIERDVRHGNNLTLIRVNYEHLKAIAALKR
jgi:hypothetical protein